MSGCSEFRRSPLQEAISLRECLSNPTNHYPMSIKRITKTDMTQANWDSLTLLGLPGKPVITVPNATVAWSCDLEPMFKKDISFKPFFHLGSSERAQTQFEDEGFIFFGNSRGTLGRRHSEYLKNTKADPNF